MKTGDIVKLALAGVGGIWLYSRYQAAKKAGVPFFAALKAPFTDAANLARSTVGMPGGQRAIPPIPQVAPDPYAPDYTPYDRDAAMEPTMLDGDDYGDN
jgi:hypothetical protein